MSLAVGTESWFWLGQLVFFVEADTVLCFGFLIKIVVVTH